MASKFKDKVRSDNQREKARSSGYGYLIIPRGYKLFQVSGGQRVRLDFLPYYVTSENHPCRNDQDEVAIPGTMWYRLPYKTHRNIGANNDSLVCPATFDKKCPICEYRTKLAREKAEEEEIRSLKSSDRNLYVVVPLKNREYDPIPHIFDISRFAFHDALREETDEKPEYQAFFDPEEGYTLNIRFSEEKIGRNKYASASRIDFEERKQQYDDEYVREEVPNLDEVLHVLTYKEIEAKFFEFDESDSEGAPEIEEDEPRRLVREDDERPRRRMRDEEEERPRRRQREEEEQPRRRAREPEAEAENERPRRRQLEEESEKEESENHERRRPLRRVRKESKRSDDEKCQFGHEYGKDADRFPKDCKQCNIWEPCFDETERNQE